MEYNPFSEEYQKAHVLDKFNTLRFERCDGTIDPDKYLQHFLALMMIQNASDVELCCLFPIPLWDSALSLLASLAPWSISSIQELEQEFRYHFVAQREIISTFNYLLTIEQQPQETVQAYIEKFNKEAMKVPSLSDREHIQACKHSLRSLSLIKVLVTKRIPSINDLLDAMHEFINGEISVQSMQEHLESRFGDNKGKKPFRAYTEH